MRYVYLGDAFSRPDLVDAPCDPIRRARDGKCIVGASKQLVVFQNGGTCVVLRRRLRVVVRATAGEGS